MKKTAYALLAALTIGLSAGGAFAAGDVHSHGAGHGELTLDHGRKWPTDGGLRHGMSEIREVIAEALPQAHSGRLDPAGYGRVADRVSAQIEYITANCKLPAEVDAQLHLVLAEIIDGADHMRKGRDPVDGMVKVLGGLDAYGKYFDHPGWKLLKH